MRAPGDSSWEMQSPGEMLVGPGGPLPGGLGDAGASPWGASAAGCGAWGAWLVPTKFPPNFGTPSPQFISFILLLPKS